IIHRTNKKSPGNLITDKLRMNYSSNIYVRDYLIMKNDTPGVRDIKNVCGEKKKNLYMLVT
ncbi:hypothetical protein, partial [Enterobacter hormaechei]|uniref:hypothetical protein n=1 Tax=Enterobacter hormaechei TaxID=158836 RepID=UPI001C3EDB11